MYEAMGQEQILVEQVQEFHDSMHLEEEQKELPKEEVMTPIIIKKGSPLNPIESIGKIS